MRFFLYTALAALLSLASAADVEITIGAPLTLTGIWAQFGIDGRSNIEMWEAFVDATPLTLANGDRIRPRFLIVDVGAATFSDMATNTRERVTEMLADNSTRIDFMLAPYSSGLTEIVAGLTEEAGVLTLAHAASADELFQCTDELKAPCERAGVRRFSKLFATLIPASKAFDTMLSLVRTRDAKNVAIAYEDNIFTKAAANGAMEDALLNKMTVSVFTSLAACTDASDENDACHAAVKDIVAELKQQQPDVFIAPVYNDLCVLFVEEMKRQSYMPKAFGLDACIGHQPTMEALGEDFRYILGTQQWNKQLTGQQFSEDSNSLIGMYPRNDASDLPSAEQYANAYQEHTGAFPSYQSASYMACLQAIHLAIAIAGEIDTDALHLALTFSEQETFFGTLSFNRYGTSTRDYVTTQNNNNMVVNENSLPIVGVDIITPLASSTAEPIYPVPTWAERVYAPTFWSTTIEKVVMGATVFALMIVSITAGLVLYMRDTTVMKSSSPMLLLTSMFGASVLLCVNFVWSLYTNDRQCVLRPILASYGFSLLFSPLFVKTFRLSRIFMSKDFSKMQVPTHQIFMFVLTPIMLDTLILLVWYISDLPQTQVAIDELRPINSITTCNSSPTFVWVMISSKIIFAGLGAVLMVRSRKIPAFFNETSSTGAAIAAVLFTALFVVPVASISSMPREVQFALRSFGTLIGVMTTCLLMLVSKFILIHDNNGDAKPSGVMGATTNQQRNQYTFNTGAPRNAAADGMPNISATRYLQHTSTFGTGDIGRKLRRKSSI